MKRAMVNLGVVLVILVATLLPIFPVRAAESDLTVRFDVIRETPVGVTVRVALRNASPKPQRDIELTTLLEGLSIPATAIKSIKVERVKLQNHVVSVPVWGERVLTEAEKQGYLDMGATPPATVPAVVSYNWEVRQREVKELYRNWSFSGSIPDTRSTTTLPGYNADRDGWGGGILVLDFTITTGLQRTASGGFGSKGVLALQDIGGTKYFDLTNSSWWNNNWQFRKVLSFDTTGITTNTVNGTAIIYITPANGFDFAKIKAGGADLRFVDSDDTTALPYLITYWDDPSENATAVVRVPQIDGGSNYSDHIYVYYGNAAASDGQSTTDQVLGVSDTSVILNDPLYGLTGDNWTSPDTYGQFTSVVGAIWTPQGRQFDGDDDKIVVSTAASLNPDYITVLTRYKFVTLKAAWQGLVSKYDSTHGWTMQVSSTAYPRVELFNSEGSTASVSSNPVSAGVWYNSAFTFDGTNIQRYRNGVADGSPTAKSGTILGSANDLWVAYRSDGNFPSNLVMAEVIVYDRALSAAEIAEDHAKTQWRHDPTKIRYGSTDPSPSVTTGEITGLATSRDGHVTGTFNGNLDDLGGAPTANVSFEYGLTASYGSSTAIQVFNAPGAVTAALPNGLSPRSTYHYRIKAVGAAGIGYGVDRTFTAPAKLSGYVGTELILGLTPLLILIGLLLVSGVVGGYALRLKDTDRNTSLFMGVIALALLLLAFVSLGLLINVIDGMLL
ncbi:MAG: DUF2341 domain-containing protein [Chloroflexi bacterium]|nr:DUF2341 domain-containing protein [Chloroflexota bacterium]